jgi:hypothetical protein
MPNHFDRSKPFYPIVMNYLVQLLGFKELAILGVTGPRELRELIDKVPVLKNIPPDKDAQVKKIFDDLSRLAGPLQLRSEFQGGTIDVDVHKMATEIAGNANYLLASFMKSAGSLLIVAHEISKDKRWHDRGPLWEFLRHCRNAAAHGGSFNLLHGEPRRPATWGSLQIKAGMQGIPLFKGTDPNGVLSPGDPIRLLWDIEQACPAMTL